MTTISSTKTTTKMSYKLNLSKCNPAELEKFRGTLKRQLQEVAEICEKHGVKYFLDWGTLLGFVRDNDIIPWDSDIDLGILGETLTIDFVKELDKKKLLDTSFESKMFYSLAELYGSFENGAFVLPRGLKVHYTEKHLYCNIRTVSDLLIYNRLGDKRFVNIEFGKCVRLNADSIGDTVKMYGDMGIYRVPEEYETYLDEIIPTWRTPDNTYENIENREFGVMKLPKLPLINYQTKEVRYE